MMEHQQNIKQRRMRAVRTAWILAAIACLIFIAFLLSAVRGN
jgi:hypothetical protein